MAQVEFEHIVLNARRQVQHAEQFIFLKTRKTNEAGLFHTNILTYPDRGRKVHRFIVLECFSVLLGGFLSFWKNFEVQDGGSKMAAFLTS